MKRFEEERHIAEHRRKLAEKLMPGRKNQTGRYRKRHPMDCGKSRCGVCAMHKRFGHEPTYQELRQMEKEKYV